MTDTLLPTLERLRGRTLTVSIHQPGYHRYLYYYYKMLVSDVFISFDTVQYVAREWQNRQLFYDHGQLIWLSVPVNKGREAIALKRITDQQELRRHWSRLADIYGRTPFFATYAPALEALYRRDWATLNDLCDALTGLARDLLAITTPYVRASDYYRPAEPLHKGDLLADCIAQLVDREQYTQVLYYPRQLPIPDDHYINQRFDGAALTEREKMERRGIAVDGFVYEPPLYRQHQLPEGHPFIANLSVFDLLFNCGPASAALLRGCGRPAEPRQEHAYERAC